MPDRENPSGSHAVSGVYAIRRSQRTYIGSSFDITTRWRKHRNHLRRGDHDNQHLQRAWTKYGEDAFEFVILEECEVEVLLEREQHHIDLAPDKYNLCPVAGSRRGVPHTPETRSKLSAASEGNKSAAGHVVSSEARGRISAAKTGREHTPEARANMSAALIGNTRNAGNTHSPETRAKMTTAALAREARKRAEKVTCS